MAAKSKKLAARLILAFDPGGSAGVALFKDMQLIGSASVNGASYVALMRAAANLIEAANAWDVPPGQRMTVIEDGFGRGIGAKTLDRRRGLCMAAAEACSMTDIRFVYPGTWHSAMFTSRVSAEMKSEAMAYCKSTWKFEPRSHDEAEACVLGWWAAQEYGQPALEAGDAS